MSAEMTNNPPAPRTASTRRRGERVELLVLHADPRPAEQALASFTREGSHAAPHYYISAAGAITRLVDERLAAHHSGLANWRQRRRNIDRISIGITLEGHRGATFSAEAATALDWLASELARRYGLDGSAVMRWLPPEKPGKAGTLEHVYLSAFLPADVAPSGPLVLGEPAEPAVVLGVMDDPAAAGRLWAALMAESYKRRGGIDFQVNWAFHLQAAHDNLGSPLAPSAPEARRFNANGQPINYQVFARDTLYNVGTNWSAVQTLSALTTTPPADGSLGFQLLKRSYEDSQAASPQPLTGAAGLNLGQAMPQRALKDRLGTPLSGNYRANVAGGAYAVQVFAGDTLFTPIAPDGQTTNWGVVKRLSDEPPGALREALWVETYKISGGSYQPAAPLQQAAAAAKLGAPLSDVFRLDFEGQPLDVQVFALDTVYAAPGGAPARLSDLPKPAAVTNWKAANPATPAPALTVDVSKLNISQPGGNRGGADWPAPSGFRFLEPAERESKFGRYAYRVNADRTVTITDGWEAANIISVPTPQLARFGKPTQRFHKLAAPQLQALLAAWEQAGLLDRILTWDGTYFPRLMRKLDKLSAHAYGSAFDINASLNGQGVIPPLTGNRGCVRELVSLANQLGFYWGGHFGGAFVDGMHFEIAVLK